MGKGRVKRSPEDRERIEAERRARTFEAVGLDRGAARLANYRDVEATRGGEARDGRKVDGNSARRLDAFDALKASMKHEPFVGCYDAARRLERDIVTRRGEGDRGPATHRVDNGRQTCREDDMVEAGKRVDAIATALPPRDYWLLTELIAPTREYATWRDIVARITGETHVNSQATAVRCACVNLRDAYDAQAKKKAA